MHVSLHTPTPNLESSRHFYTRLGFKQISKKPVCFTDGKACIEINPERFARAGFKFYGTSWDSQVDALRKHTAVIAQEDGFLVSDPNGVWIYLSTDKAPDFTPEESSFGTLGNYAGISLETTDMERSLEFYKTLGLEVAGGSPEAGFLALHLDNFDVNLMKPNSCPHLFFNPSLTYFNGGQNLPVIENIRKAKIPITEEITVFNTEGIVDNVIIRDPGGYGFFVFND